MSGWGLFRCMDRGLEFPEELQSCRGLVACLLARAPRINNLARTILLLWRVTVESPLGETVESPLGVTVESPRRTHDALSIGPERQSSRLVD